MNISLSKSTKYIVALTKRFPITLTLSLIATGLAIYLVDRPGTSDFLFLSLSKVLMTILLGIVATLGASILNEHYRLDGKKQLLSFASVVLFLFLFYCFGGSLCKNEYILLSRFTGLLIMLHLVITVLPFRGEFTDVKFTSWNIAILARFLETSLFTLIIYIGLSLANLSLDKLFDISFFDDGMGYIKLFLLLIGTFHTFHFLSGIPTPLQVEEGYKSGRVMKVLTQYILIPIVILYGLILFAYLAKTIASGAWPLPWVSNLQIWFFVLGILTYLMNYHLKVTEHVTISKIYCKWYFIISIPLLLFMMGTLYNEIQLDGITPGTYLLAMLSIWIFIITMYILISKLDDIRILPTGLALAVMVGAFGPFSLINCLKHSQQERVVQALENRDIIKDGILQEIPDGKHIYSDTISTAVRLLSDINALQFIKQYDQNKILPDTLYSSDLYDWMNNGNRVFTGDNRKMMNFSQKKRLPIPIEEYQMIIPYVQAHETLKTIDSMFLKFSKKEEQFEYHTFGNKTIIFSNSIRLIDSDQPNFILEKENLMIHVYARYLSAYSEGDSLKVKYLDPEVILVK